jgi:hypothetical protein
MKTRTSVLAVGAWLSMGMSAVVSGQGQPADDKLILSAPLTHSDWVMKDGIDTGAAGVRHMLDMCKAAGWSRVYWRMLDSGMSLYPSKLRDPMAGPKADNYFAPKPEDVASGQPNAAILEKMAARFHYGDYDSFAEAVRYGHTIGLEIHAWFSINEDDHGWGWPSRFAVQHPEYRWVRRDGRPYHSQLSFAFPQVRKHKLNIIREVVRKYAVDGVFLDWIRTGDVRDNPQVDANGVADFGYEKPLIEGFRKTYGVDPREIPNDDPRWVAYRAQPITEFMRSVRTYLTSARPAMPLTVMVQHPWGYRGSQCAYAGTLRGLLLDVGTWSREGLVDAAVAAGYYKNGGTPEKAYNDLRNEVGDQVDVWYFGWVPGDPASFDSQYAEARKVGARQILFWEADYIDNPPQDAKEALQRHMSEKAIFPAPKPATPQPER